MRDTRRSAADRVLEEKKRIAADAHGPMSTGRWVWEWTRSFLIAVGLFLFIRTFLIEAFRIPTGSMENTLLVGDFLLVNKAAFGVRIPFSRARTPALAQPARGDVIVFVPPHDPGRNYVKRLLGMPGDTLEMRSKTLYINGRPQTEPYVRYLDVGDRYAVSMTWQCDHGPASGGGACRPTRDNWGPVVVPDAHYFMLGDNRDDSQDSRYWGFVERTAVRGEPLFVYYSFDPSSARSARWVTSLRWHRVGRRVH